MKIIIINGPNLNLLGRREPSIYGAETFQDYFNQLKERHQEVELSYFQSNIEGELIDKIHETGFSYDGIILNAAAYTHTSVGIGDAIKGVETPVVEVDLVRAEGGPQMHPAAGMFFEFRQQGEGSGTYHV